MTPSAPDEPWTPPVPAGLDAPTMTARAEAVIQAVDAGADPTMQAWFLSNAYTDSVTERIRTAIRKFFRRS